MIETADELDVQQEETMEKWISASSCIIDDQTNNTFNDMAQELIFFSRSPAELRSMFAHFFLFYFHCSAKRLHKWRKKTTIMPTERKNENEKKKTTESEVFMRRSSSLGSVSGHLIKR